MARKEAAVKREKKLREIEKRHQAAIKIQSCFRRKRAYQILQDKINLEIKKEITVIKLQCIWRARKQRTILGLNELV